MRNVFKTVAKFSFIVIFGVWLALSVHSYVVTNAASRNYIPLLVLAAYVVIAGAFKIIRRLTRMKNE